MTKPYLLLTAVCVVVLFNFGFAQQLPDSAAYNATLNFYIESSGEQSEIYNGYEYSDIRADIGSVYFLDNKQFTMATLVYNGSVYKNIPVLYDALNDLLISKRPNSPVKYVMVSDRVASFQIGSHRFIRVAKADVKDAAKERYYEELYNGKSSVIAKRSKIRSEILSRGEGLRISFENDDLIYIKKGGVFYPVKSRGDVLKLFKDKEDALKAYIKSAALSFGEKKEEAIVKLANYYDQLSL